MGPCFHFYLHHFTPAQLDTRCVQEWVLMGVVGVVMVRAHTYQSPWEVQYGEYDSQLNWPLLGSVTFTLLNQLEDKIHQ